MVPKGRNASAPIGGDSGRSPSIPTGGSDHDQYETGCPRPRRRHAAFSGSGGGSLAIEEHAQAAKPAAMAADKPAAAKPAEAKADTKKDAKAT